MKRILILLLASSLLLSGCAVEVAKPAETEGKPVVEHIPVIDPIDDNYRTFYQIFVGSFSDSNRDGIGDLRGIINRLDYLNDGDITSGESLGIQGIWLSPIFSSPSYHKYDASDYYEIDWRFGTMEDLRELAQLCEERNIKLILDLVINHTSTKHPWFLSFKEARIAGDTENPYYDFYSCATTAEKVGGITYQKIAGVDCWYECNFSPEMPELNFDNEAVRQAVLDVAKYYLDMGIDGFRFDAVKYIYYGDAERSVGFWSWYMEQLEAMDPEIYCVGECWSGESEILQYQSAMNCFNFAMSQAEGMAASTAKNGSVQKFTTYVASFQQKVLEADPQSMPMSFLSNHDMDRIAGTFATENNMRMAANLYMLSPGSPMMYYGEEIGLRGSRGGEMTDANRRLAMLWGDPEDLVRDPEGSTYPTKNQIQTTVADQLEDPNSLYNYYCRLIALRHSHEAIARGTYQSLPAPEKQFGGFRIDYAGETLILLHNTSMEEVSYDLGSLKGLEELPLTELLGFIGVGEAKLEGTLLTVGPQTSVILK
ncbi:MAG: hypothetical protein IJN47_02740 [Clostridia bacterium]|nr:hypothetical protein [Clostridia bacterium]